MAVMPASLDQANGNLGIKLRQIWKAKQAKLDSAKHWTELIRRPPMP
jgi:hypothetical protein